MTLTPNPLASIFHVPGFSAGRDFAGAFNIMLKALVDRPDLLQVAVNES